MGQLRHGDAAGARDRSARWIREAVAIEQVAFVLFSSLGRHWLAGDVVAAASDGGWSFARAGLMLPPPRFFAIEAAVARRVLSLSSVDAPEFGFKPLPAYGAEPARDVFPDSLAVLSLAAKVEPPERVTWKGGHLSPL